MKEFKPKRWRYSNLFVYHLGGGRRAINLAFQTAIKVRCESVPDAIVCELTLPDRTKIVVIRRSDGSYMDIFG